MGQLLSIKAVVDELLQQHFPSIYAMRHASSKQTALLIYSAPAGPVTACLSVFFTQSCHVQPSVATQPFGLIYFEMRPLSQPLRQVIY